MSAVANSSSLIALSTIDQLALLLRRFPEGIAIPPAVWREVVETGQGQPGAEEVANSSWITVRDVKNTGAVSLLAWHLDDGEAEAIVLCQELGSDVLVLDEKDARRTARRLGLKVLGTVGLLIWARRTGLLATSLREQLDALRDQGDFHLSQTVYDEALRAVGELTR